MPKRTQNDSTWMSQSIGHPKNLNTEKFFANLYEAIISVIISRFRLIKER